MIIFFIGRIQTKDIKELLTTQLEEVAVSYVCGPISMINDSIIILKELGISNVRYEKWW